MRGYRPYRGRKTRLAKTILAGLAAVVFALLCASYLTGGLVRQAVDNFLQFSSDILGPENPSQTEPTEPTEPTQGGESKPTEPEPTVSSPVELSQKAIMVDAEMVKAGQLPQNIKSAGYNSVAIRIKDSGGRVSLNAGSAFELVADSAAGVLLEISDITALKAEDIYTVAVINCFEDDLAPRKYAACATKLESNVMWLDRNNKRWIDPYSEGAFNYISALVLEAAAAGFDEIMLDGLIFPTEGKLNLISYKSSGVDKSGAIANFVARIKEILPENVSLSVAVSANAVSDQDFAARSGAGTLYEDYAADIIRPYVGNDQIDLLIQNRGGAEIRPVITEDYEQLAARLTGAGFKSFMLYSADYSYYF